ncbi:GntR family transcriptional regulator [Imbroritus primus]|uniref:GntR family transcriptional regulator n=1 Tax=Imbroritus primus TaxID=3058603 RepID=UPI003D16129A
MIKKAVPANRAKSSGTEARSAVSTNGAKAKLTDLAYERIEEAIVTLALPPGSAISELQLSEMTGIGRTPIREAIQRLARERLIMVLPQRGLLIPEIDVARQLRLLETRREVERLICRSGAKRATPAQRERFRELVHEFEEAAAQNDDVRFVRADRDLNELTLAASHNEFAEGAMRLMHGLSRRFWYYHYKQAADMPEMGRLHANVARAIADGDVDGAGKALDALLDNIESFTRNTVLDAR